MHCPKIVLATGATNWSPHVAKGDCRAEFPRRVSKRMALLTIALRRQKFPLNRPPTARVHS